MSRIKKTANHPTISCQESEDKDFVAEIKEEEELQFGKASESRGQKQRRTLEEIATDKRKTWESSMDCRKFKNEGQVDAEALKDDHRGLRYTDKKGLNF